MKLIEEFTYTNFHKKEFNNFVVDSFIVGFFSYCILYLIKYCFKLNFHLLQNINDLDQFNSIDFIEILFSIIISIIICSAYSYIKNQDCIHEFLRKKNILNKSSNESIFYTIYNKKDYSEIFFQKWVRVKLKDYPNVEYLGALTQWSLLENFIEILLEDVTVYKIDKNYEYETFAVNIKTNYENILFEFVNSEENKEVQGNE